MNALSLRVSSIRNGENLKKNSEIRIALLCLPEKHQLPTSTPTDVHIDDDDLTNLKRNFSDATSIDQQLVTIRRWFTSISPDIDSESLTRILQLFVDVFFYAPLKHPVRNAIAKLLQKSQLFHGLITTCLVSTITDQTSCQHNQRSASELNALITSIGGCFENVPVTLIAVKICLPAIFAGIHAALQEYTSVLQQSGCSPASRSELHIYVHSAVRLTLSSLQLCFDQTRVVHIEAALLPIVTHCERLIRDEAVPMDTKVNCGQLLLMHAKLLDRLDEVFDEIETASRVEGADNDDTIGGTLRTLVLCVGTVTTITEAHLLSARGCGVLQHVVAHLVRIAGRSVIEQNVLIAAARGLVQLSKILLQFQLPLVGDSDDTGDRLQRLEQLTASCLGFVWTFAEHYLDSVRHLSRDVLRNLLRLAYKHRERGLFAGLIDECVTSAQAASTSSSSVRCLVIDQLGQVFGSGDILARIPDVCSVLTAHLSETNWAACYDRLMVSSCMDMPLGEWYERWLRPVLGHRGRQSTPLAAREMIIVSAVRVRPEVVALIVADKSTLPEETYLFAMWTVRKSPAKATTTTGSTTAGWRPAEDPVLIAAKVHSNDAVRIMPLRILVDVNRSTEPFSEVELFELIDYLYYNCNSQSPAMRMQILAHMQKAFHRIEASHAVAERKGDVPTTLANESFLRQLCDLCVGNLFHGANFGRRLVSLNLLLQVVRVSQKICQAKRTVWTRQLIDVLQRTVTVDTYESNKVVALEVLKFCPKDLNPIRTGLEPTLGLTELSQMLTSIRPDDSLSAAYLTEYCCMFGWHFDSTFAAIEWCERLLMVGLNVAKGSLLTAARQNPLYGLVFCIRHLVGTVDLNVQPAGVWRPFVSRFIDTCTALLALVAPIVNSSSPEGHTTEDALDNSDDNSAGTTTSQMLLMCAWRTVKEVSLFLGELALRAPIVRQPGGDGGAGLLSIADLLSIGRTFQTMLAETKHRGAFEQAYVGFSKLCVRLWRSNEPELHRCPMRWLRSLIDLIASNEPATGGAAEPIDRTGDDDVAAIQYESICTTRRSAGVPYMIQALITSELQVCSAHGLHYGMRRLLALSRHAEHAETRTHALNILRALFRCTDLGTAVAEYVADTLCVAIDGYAATGWPERNAATLLFAALMTRVFGVQRGRLRRHTDTLSVRNRMTGRIFFLRYPRLYDYLAGQLAAAERSIAERSAMPATLHPLLLLLSRLYASALEGCESSLRLSTFLPAVQLCSVRCAELQTRRLAVRSMVALLPPAAVWPHLDGAVGEILAMLAADRFDSNAAHGLLMQVEVLVRAASEQQAQAAQVELWALLEALIAAIELWSVRRTNFVLLHAFVDGLVAILLRLQRVGDRGNTVAALRMLCERWESMLFGGIQNANTAADLIGRPEAVKSLVLCIVLVAVKFEAIDHTFIVYRRGIMSGSFEYMETVLNLLQLLFTAHSRANENCAMVTDEDDEDDDDEFANTLLEHSVAEVVIRRPNVLDAIVRLIRGSPDLRGELLLITRDPRYQPVLSTKAFELLGELDTDLPDFRMNELEMAIAVSQLDSQSDNVKNAIYRYLSTQVHFADEQMMLTLYHHLGSSAHPNALVKLRLSVAVCLSKMILPLGTNHLPRFSYLVLMLLVDDHVHVRQRMAKYVQSFCDTKANDGASIIGIRAVEIFLQWLDAELDQTCTGNDDKAKIWFLMIEQMIYGDATRTRLDKSEVFNESGTDLFGEKMHTAQMMLVWLKRNCTSRESHMVEKYAFLNTIVCRSLSINAN